MLKPLKWSGQNLLPIKAWCLILLSNYGARDEIIRAARSLARQVEEGKLRVGDINEETFSRALYTSGLPDPDLLIRTAGNAAQ